ncbi:hypothetical protein ACFY1A_20820 [Streptomyces sp. NPDC001520]|uniref:hypothetical protein n=1 Tax=Streptomyces sp. NPDC001520 TaxID=3364581 RepID=UPI0036D0E0D5
MPIVTEFCESKQYDGTNGADVAAWLDGPYTIASDTGTQLVLVDWESTRKVIPRSGWVVRDSSRNLMWQGSDAAYRARWVEITRA